MWGVSGRLKPRWDKVISVSVDGAILKILCSECNVRRVKAWGSAA